MVTNKKKGKTPSKPKASKAPSKGTKALAKTAVKTKAVKKATSRPKSSATATIATKAPSKTSRSKEITIKTSNQPISAKAKKSSKKATESLPAQKTEMHTPSEMKATQSPESKVSPRFPLHESMMPYKFEPYHPKQGEEYMSDAQLKHFRGILDTWKRELMKEVDHTISEMKGASVLADPNDRATQEEAFNLELRTRDRERKLIRKIEEALQQIEDKEYGYCESCGVEIGIRRLEARPTAVLCIDCKTLDEIRERNIQ